METVQKPIRVGEYVFSGVLSPAQNNNIDLSVEWDDRFNGALEPSLVNLLAHAGLSSATMAKIF